MADDSPVIPTNVLFENSFGAWTQECVGPAGLYLVLEPALASVLLTLALQTPSRPSVAFVVACIRDTPVVAQAGLSNVRQALWHQGANLHDFGFGDEFVAYNTYHKKTQL